MGGQRAGARIVIEFEQPSSFLRTRHSRAAAGWQRQAMIVDFVFSSCRIGCARAKRSLRSADASASKAPERRSEEHTSELQSLMRISYAVFCLKNKNNKRHNASTWSETKTMRTPN